MGYNPQDEEFCKALDKWEKEQKREAKRTEKILKEKILNKFRDQINKEAGVEVMPYKAKVIFEEKNEN